MSLKNSFIVLWVYVMYLIGIWVFFSGYLLKRIVVNKNNTEILSMSYDIKCGDYSWLRTFDEELKPIENISSSSRSAHLKRFRKSIIIVIDGMRYDFMLHNNSLKSHYLDKLPIFLETKEKYHARSLLTKLIADPPTTTLQRLSGIVTGSLPTFIDLSLNFASSSASEDNIIWRLNEMQKKIVFLGDEVWESLFPGQFHRSFPFPSFNVKDLDTVDNGILANIFTEMEKDDWDVLIAHFLGVDHCGHRYGLNHPAMTKKLQQMNTAVSDIMSRMPNDTILAVFGDHGVTENGDHGGDSLNETTTALFLYSHFDILHVFNDREAVLQIDLLPTLSLLLGLPIPFSNLGSVIPELFTIQTSSKDNACFSKEIDPHLASALALTENAYQVARYIREYSLLSQDLSASALKEADTLFSETTLLWKNINEDTNITITTLQSLSEGYQNYIKLIQQECIRIWAKFDLPLMTCGCIILCISLYLNILFAYNLTIRIIQVLPISICVLIIFCVMSYLTHSFYVVCLVLLLNIYFMFFRKRIRWMFEIVLKLCTLPNIVTICVCLTSFSNSFVVYENAVILFMLQTVLVYRYGTKFICTYITSWLCNIEKSKRLKSLNKKNVLMNFLVPGTVACLLLFIRLGTVFQKCREEQAPCENSIFLTSLENLPDVAASSYHVFRLTSSWMAILLPLAFFLIWIKFMLPGKNYTTAMICINYGLTFSIVCIGLNWWLMMIPSPVLEKMLGQNQMIPARCAMITCVVVFFCTWVFPLLPEKPLDSPTNVIFSSSLILFLFSLLLPLYIVAGDGIAMAIMLMSLSAMAVLILDNSNSEPDSNALIVTWWLLACHWFYGTGHQNTFPAIHWDSGFTINKQVISYTLTGLLITMNTFSSQIFHGLSLPMILVWSQPPKEPQRPLFHLLLKYILLSALKLLSAVVSCFILRRHLMVWKIFTPKLIFEAAGFLVTIICVFISYLFIWRVTSCFYKQIKKNVGQLWFLKDE